MTGEELQIGSVGVSVILSILLRMLYGTVEIGNRAKPWISVGLGISLAIVVMLMTSSVNDFKTVASYCVQGFMVGATATGLYEMTKSSK
jgi:hypothetical protein